MSKKFLYFHKKYLYLYFSHLLYFFAIYQNKSLLFKNHYQLKNQNLKNIHTNSKIISKSLNNYNKIPITLLKITYIHKHKNTNNT